MSDLEKPQTPPEESRRTARRLTVEGRHVDVRVVTIPSVHGERGAAESSKGGRELRAGQVGTGLEREALHDGAFNRRTGRFSDHGTDGLGQVDVAVRRAHRANTTPEKNIITIEDRRVTR